MRAGLPSILSFVISLLLADAAAAQTLSGQVRAAGAGTVQGAIVSARAEGAAQRVSVIADKDGRYAFPAGRLAAGPHAVTVRAGLWQLAAPASVEVKDGAVLNLELRKAQDPAPLLSDAEWLASMPGTDAQKGFLTSCIDCHTLQRILSSKHDAAGFVQIFQRMAGYALGSSPQKPQLLVGGPQDPVPVGNPRITQSAQYLASVNLSSSARWSYELKTLPLATGKAARAVITEYELPRADAKPHDLLVDAEGMVWYSDFGSSFLGQLDPKTGKVTEHAVPELRPGFPTGSFDLAQDGEGNLWLAMMYQGGVARFDRAAKSFKTFPLPADWLGNYTQVRMVTLSATKPGAKLWTNNQDGFALYSLDPATGRYENLGSLKMPGSDRPLATYGMPGDKEDNLYLFNFAGNQVVKFETASGRMQSFATPTPASRPRRGGFDAQGRLWFAEFGANSVAMLDPETRRTREWPLPTAWSVPSDVRADKHGQVWGASMLADRILRLDPDSGAVTDYPLPRHSSLWRIALDESGPRTTVWVADDHGAALIKLEPLD